MPSYVKSAVPVTVPVTVVPSTLPVTVSVNEAGWLSTVPLPELDAVNVPSAAIGNRLVPQSSVP